MTQGFGGSRNAKPSREALAAGPHEPGHDPKLWK
jgi:hypothetical protein